MARLPLISSQRPDRGNDIPNGPFEGDNMDGEVVNVSIQTTNGLLTIENAIVRETSIKVDAQSFVEGGFDLGTF